MIELRIRYIDTNAIASRQTCESNMKQRNDMLSMLGNCVIPFITFVCNFQETFHGEMFYYLLYTNSNSVFCEF